MKRILVNIPNDQIDKLAYLAHIRKVSRAEVVREAVEKYLKEVTQLQAQWSLDNSFGAWKGKAKTVDGLEYQKQERAQW